MVLERTIDGDFEVDTKYHGNVPQIIEKQRTGGIFYPIHSCKG